MAIDEATLKLLELEYVDDLGNSLESTVFGAGQLKAIYASGEVDYQGRNLDEVFLEKYESMKSGFNCAKDKLAIADGRSEEHTPFFYILKNYFEQMDTALDALSAFWEGDERPTDFKDSFQPYLKYLDMIETASEGINLLARIYSDLVDTNMLSNRYCTKLDEEN